MPTIRISHLLILIVVLIAPYGCGRKEITVYSSQEYKIPSTYPIYEDISVFEKPPCTAPSVEISGGEVCGSLIDTSGGKSVKAYLGIPFAESTGGQNRWKPPVPKPPWDGMLRATRLGPACPQNESFSYPQSEDCLSINVWSPAEPSHTPRALMVYIYGGAFAVGYNADPLYNGAYTAAYGDVVVVSMNYRVGALEFLAGVKDKKTGEEINGNFGIMDQRLALEWVRDNISAFGGDPGKVTLYGESAGAMSTGIHLVSPESRDLFRAAIVESNPYGVPYKDLEQARAIAGKFAHNLGCPSDDIGCMREKLPAVVLYDQLKRNMIWPVLFEGISDMLLWSPVVDGVVIREQPLQAALEGVINKPVIVGSNRNEALLFVEKTKGLLGWDNISDFGYKLIMGFIFRDDEVREKIYAKYPPDGGDNTGLISKVLSEYLFICPNLYVASNNHENIRSYFFDHVSSFNVWPGIPACADAVCHAAELQFVFHTPEGRRGEFTPEENELSDLMIGYWTDFAKNLTPDGSAGAWPTYIPGSRTLVFKTPVNDVELRTDTGADCEFWDHIGYSLPESFMGMF